jgi:hypothetical protein
VRQIAKTLKNLRYHGIETNLDAVVKLNAIEIFSHVMRLQVTDRDRFHSSTPLVHISNIF